MIAPFFTQHVSVTMEYQKCNNLTSERANKVFTFKVLGFSVYLFISFFL